VIVRLRALSERVRNSLFFVPVACVIFALALAAGMLELDARVNSENAPSLLRFTVDSAREVLATVAGAIITVAAIVFALTGLSVQLASSQFSPRVVRGFLRDRNQQLAIGFMVGTFTYALVILRAVRSPSDDPEVVPVLSTGLALGLTVAAVIGIVAFVSRTTHRLQSSELVRSVTDETIEAVVRLFPPGGRGEPRALVRAEPRGPGRRVRACSAGWITQISPDELLHVLPPGGTARVDVEVGQFVHRGRRICTVWGETADEPNLDRSVNRAFAVATSRSMQQDVGFGIRQIADIGLRALSPGVNDPTTAHECIVHLGAVSYEFLRRDLPPAEIDGDGGRRVLLGRGLDYADVVAQAFDEIRQSAASLPSVATALVETLAGVAADLVEDGVDPARIEPLARQARLVVAGVRQGRPLAEDLAAVEVAAAFLLGRGSESSSASPSSPAT